MDEKKHLTTEWSDAFSLDAVGSEGIFKCEIANSNHVYQVKISFIWWHVRVIHAHMYIYLS